MVPQSSFAAAAVPIEARDIEPDHTPPCGAWMFDDPACRCALDTVALIARERVLGSGGTATAPTRCSHLDERKHIVARDHQIELTAPAAEISLQDAPAALLEIAGDGLFAALTECTPTSRRGRWRLS